jgi:hypothetical protein
VSLHVTGNGELTLSTKSNVRHVQLDLSEREINGDRVIVNSGTTDSSCYVFAVTRKDRTAMTYSQDPIDMTSTKILQRFMYNVFAINIHTTKGKNCVREESTSFEAQTVDASRLDVYHDHLSNTLTSRLTLMKLEDKWRKSFESFLYLWTENVQDLDGIEVKMVDDDTRLIWLTSTL